MADDSYLPQFAPSAQDADALKAALQQEFENIARSLTDTQILQLRVRHTEPEKPRAGMIVYADGTDWDPGEGTGIYAYIGSTWEKFTTIDGVLGPESSTDGGIVLFDGESGSVIKEANATLDLSDPLDDPFVVPAYYTGDVVLTPSDPWERVIRLHDGNGDIELSDGTYTASSTLTISARRLTIFATNVGGAEVVGGWQIDNQRVVLSGLDLTPTGRLMRSDEGWVEFQDCDVDASAAVSSQLVLATGTTVRITSNTRISTWDIGPDISADVFDLDSGSYLKIVGNNTSNDVRFNVEEGDATRALFTLDGSGLLIAGCRCFVDPLISDANDSHDIGINARRGSVAIIQDSGNRIEGFEFGVMARQTSRVLVSGITLRFCHVALRKVGDSPVIHYNDDTTTFSSNNTDSSVAASPVEIEVV